jgi:glycolate oxidase
MELGSALQRRLPAGSVVTDPDIVGSYSADHADWVVPGKAAAVVFPTSTEEVSAVVRLARQEGVPVVTRGAGSGLSGGAAAVDGCIVVCLDRMNRIIEVDEANQLAVVQPGVVNGDLKRAARAVGLWYPPDPASFEFSTIGGNLATNAGGLCCLKYGVTADFALGLEVVLSDGSVARFGRRTVKGVAGYDLTRLFVGSEGTLGIITEATVRLRPAPSAPATAVAVLPSLAAAGGAIEEIMRSGPVPSLLELMDRTTIRAVDDWQRMELDRDAAAIVLAQSDAPGGGALAEAAEMARRCEAVGATYTAVTDDPDEGEALLTARRLAYPALERLGATLLDDVAVPRSNLALLIEAVDEVSTRHGLTIGTFGHAGDGNLHPTIVYDRADQSSGERALAAFDDIVAAALALSGTVTGEHGVGVLKRAWLERELDAGAASLHRLLKDALDPDGILNPGKVTMSSK